MCRTNDLQECNGFIGAYGAVFKIIILFRVKAIPELFYVLTIMDSAVQDGETALQRASREGHQKVVELLLEAGANPDLQDKVRVEHVHANLSAWMLSLRI